MKCKKCGEVKLSNEFPPFKLVDSCFHPSLHCLRCVTSHWETTKQCSQCGCSIEHTSLNLRKCYQTLEILFPEIHMVQQANDDSSAMVSSGKMTVMRLNGEAAEIDYNSRFSIYKVKQLVQEFMKVPPEKQRLVYNGKEMKDFQADNMEATLSTYGVNAGSTIHLMVLLCAVPTGLNKVVFDLYWGYPTTTRGVDFLDASALLFSGSTYIEVVDYHKKSQTSNAIKHSGDLMDNINRRGHHIINVELQKIPVNVTNIVFTLSAYYSPTISSFQNPSLKFYEQSNPSKMLCTDQIKKAGHRQAIVMCSLSRRGGQWFVDGNGALSDGNAIHYGPLISTIQGLLKTMGN